MDGFAKTYGEFVAKPFSEDMPATHWILFIGFFLMIVFAWRFVLVHLITAVSAASK